MIHLSCVKEVKWYTHMQVNVPTENPPIRQFISSKIYTSKDDRRIEIKMTWQGWEFYIHHVSHLLDHDLEYISHQYR